MSRTIGGFPAEKVEIDVGTIVDGVAGPERSIALYRVAGLESLVDRDELLRAKAVTEPPYWALVWIGARAIAARLLAEPPPGDARVLDLGCGLGLTGVVAGAMGCEVLFADHAEAALAFAAANAELHGLEGWRTRTVDFSVDRLGERFDLILAADVVYNPHHYRPLVEFLDVHLASGGTLLLTETLRADAREVLHMLAARGYACTTVAAWITEEGRPERTWLHALRRGHRS